MLHCCHLRCFLCGFLCILLHARLAASRSAGQRCTKDNIWETELDRDTLVIAMNFSLAGQCRHQLNTCRGAQTNSYELHQLSFKISKFRECRYRINVYDGLPSYTGLPPKHEITCGRLDTFRTSVLSCLLTIELLVDSSQNETTQQHDPALLELYITGTGAPWSHVRNDIGADPLANSSITWLIIGTLCGCTALVAITVAVWCFKPCKHSRLEQHTETTLTLDESVT